MKSSDLIDRTAVSADVKQTGVRFQYSRFSLQPTDCRACTPHPQIVIMEVCKSLGSAANE
ncbi:hypothetical protein SAMN05216591_3381 [Pseudomonas extremaustralis]|uniref:Uncharacterized protein n=1 Tax=Pseudomonas extremaustralis TaxID=359110 RepID=A0ABY0NL21_9PSED|nr:hypothetical protein SAMN05216591_3381 [Pseudomonas extremaustralis]